MKLELAFNFVTLHFCQQHGQHQMVYLLLVQYPIPDYGGVYAYLSWLACHLHLQATKVQGREEKTVSVRGQRHAEWQEAQAGQIRSYQL